MKTECLQTNKMKQCLERKMLEKQVELEKEFGIN